MNVIAIFQNLLQFCSTSLFFFYLQITSLIVMSVVGFVLIKTYIYQHAALKKNDFSFFYLLFIIVALCAEYMSWIVVLLPYLKIYNVSFFYINLWLHCAWILSVFSQLALILFLESLLEPRFKFKWYHKLLFSINCGLTLFYVDRFFNRIYNSTAPYSYFITTISRSIMVYDAFCVVPFFILIIYKLYHNPTIPALLKKQVSTLLTYIIIPHSVLEIIELIPYFGPDGLNAQAEGIVGLSEALLMISGVIYCAFYLTRLRLFNFSDKVQDPSNPPVSTELKDFIEEIGSAKNQVELVYLTHKFFEKVFKISSEFVCLNFRTQEEACMTGTDMFCKFNIKIIESFLDKNEVSIDILKHYRILVVHDIAFDAYYAANDYQITLTKFLDEIDCDIFLPLFFKNSIVAYITVRKTNRQKFYSQEDQNKMLIFSSYLASSLNIMKNENMFVLLKENKMLRDELYFKHQEMNQYKESLKTQVKQKMDQSVGIIFYQNNRFSFGNEVAQKLLPLNLNQQKNHPAVLVLQRLADQIELFKTPQSSILYDSNKQQLLVSCLSHVSQSAGLIYLVYQPDIAQIIKTQIDQLYDPSRIDYILYLQTTKAGQIINQMIPSNSESLLNFKINLLEATLQRKALLLQSHSDDLECIVEIIHSLSLRKTLHILDLKPTELNYDLSAKIFGLNPILLKNQEEPLLKKLDKVGTLCIKNVDLLDLATQDKLADFIQYGQFTFMKSEQKIVADVRIIFSTSQSIDVLKAQNKISEKLHENLVQTKLIMPSLLSLNQDELHELIEGLAIQEVHEQDYAHLLQLTKNDKDQIVDYRPVSLHEVKYKIRSLIAKKSDDHEIVYDTHIDPSLNITNPKLLHAARLGKNALKDSELMSLLWDQFHCQNKIALFLGVNRSSVNRRCKEYNLLEKFLVSEAS